MIKHGVIEKYHRQRIRARIASIGILVCLLLLLLIGALTYFGTNVGMFTISVGDRLNRYGVGIAETKEGPYGARVSTRSIRCAPVTYANINFDEIVNSDGDYYKGKNYLAYTFYIKNTGEYTTPVHVSMELLERTKNIDSAIRIAYIRDGKQEIFLKDDENVIDPNDKTPYETAKYFASSKYVFVQDEDDLHPGEVRKFSIIIWVEGWDAQCDDALIGGSIKFRMLYEIPRETDS